MPPLRVRSGWVACGAKEVPLSWLQVSISCSGGNSLPRLAPAPLGLAVRRPVDPRIRTWLSREPTPRHRRGELQNFVVRRPPDPICDVAFAAQSRHAVALALASDGRKRHAPTRNLEPADAATEGWAFVKRQIAGTYHRPSSKHLTAYWNEARWRAENLGKENTFRATVQALIASEPLPWDRLVQPIRKS